MSDTVATPASPQSKYQINIREEDVEYFRECNSKKDWRSHLTGSLMEKIDDLRAIRFVRFALLAAVAFLANIALNYFAGDKLPGWGVSLVMVTLLVYPVLSYCDMARQLKHFTSPVRLARFFRIMRVEVDKSNDTDEGKGTKKFWADEATAEHAIRDIFKLKVPTKVTDGGKIKRDKSKVDPYPAVMFLPESINVVRRFSWFWTIALLAVLVFASGKLLNVIFPIIFAAAIAFTWLYRRDAMRLALNLAAAAHKAGLNDEDDAEDSDDTDTPTAPADDTVATTSEDAVIDLVFRVHNGEELNAFDKSVLKDNFPDGIPTIEELTTSGTTPESTSTKAPSKKKDAKKKTAPADTSIDASVNTTAVLPTIPVTDDTTDSSTPVNNKFTPEEIDALIDRHFNGDTLTREEYAAIEKYVDFH